MKPLRPRRIIYPHRGVVPGYLNLLCYRLFRGLHWHDWELIRDSGKYLYAECLLCGTRGYAEYNPSGHQPLDRDWLEHKAGQMNGIPD